MRKQIMITTILAVVLTATAGLFAQKRQGGKEGKKEMHAYLEKNVVPVMKTQRDKLEMVLTAGEKQEVEAIRADLKTLREERKAHRPEFRQMKKDGEGPTDAQKQLMQECKKENKALMDRAKAIVDKHENTINKLLDEVGDDQEQWKADLKAISEKQREERKANMEERGGERPAHAEGKGHHRKHNDEHEGENHDGKHRGMRGHKGGKGLGHMTKPVGFLLWDGALPESGQKGKSREGFGNKQQDVETLIFPNPSQGVTTIQYQVKESGPVKITLLNQEGGVEKQLLNESQEPGSYTKSFDLKDLTPGVYYYKIKTVGNRDVKKFLVE